MTHNHADIHIVPVGLAMTPLLSKLHGACFDEVWDEAAMRELMSMPGAMSFVIGTAPDTPAGFVIANRAADQADILSIGILPGDRRRALGRKLLSYLAERLRSEGTSAIFLEVAADNIAAIGLYRSCGYVELGERKNYYASDRSNRTAVQMKCELDV